MSILSALIATASVTQVLAQDSQQSFETDAAASFETAIADPEIPGLIVGVTRNGQHHFDRTGLPSREDQRPVTPDTLFELGSISKIFNVTLAALADERAHHRKTDAPIRVTPGVLDDEAYGVTSSARHMLTLLDVELASADVSAEIQNAVSRTQMGQFRTSLFPQAMIWEAYPWPVDPGRLVGGTAMTSSSRPNPCMTGRVCPMGMSS